jgi:hypothetical protein
MKQSSEEATSREASVNLSLSLRTSVTAANLKAKRPYKRYESLV